MKVWYRIRISKYNTIFVNSVQIKVINLCYLETLGLFKERMIIYFMLFQSGLELFNRQSINAFFK